MKILKKCCKILAWIIVLSGVFYGVGRIYFKVTDGFQIANISSDFAYDSRWDTREISEQETENVRQILSQKFTYLGKGCQSYVFQSDDGEYVVKFFKYQRFRPQFYIYWFSFLPPVKNILNQKIEKKRIKREALFTSWVTAFDHLPNQTGLVYVHLNKTLDLNKQIKIIDKMGMEHVLNSDEMEFLIQKKATMLCPTLEKLVNEGNIQQAKDLLTDLVRMVDWEYQNGIADHDHALMQNRGVYHNLPVHIDVGQFEKNEAFKDPQYYHQQLYNKTWKFRNWLRKKYPELLEHIDQELYKVLGEDFYTIKFIPKEH